MKLKSLFYRSPVLSALSLTLTLALAAGMGNASASTVIGATGVSSPQGTLGGRYPLVNTINQSSLSATYVSGITDFASYTATTTSGQLIGSGFTGFSTNGPQQFTFDLGASFSIDGIAIWNTDSVGAISRFDVYADDDGDFSNGVGAQILGPSSLNTSSAANVFDFASVQTRYVHLQGLASLDAPDFYGLNEVVFSGTTAPVPEPETYALMLAGLAMVGAAARRRKAK